MACFETVKALPGDPPREFCRAAPIAAGIVWADQNEGATVGDFLAAVRTESDHWTMGCQNRPLQRPAETREMDVDPSVAFAHGQ